MKNNGETLDTISQILGHSNTNITKIYIIHSLAKAKKSLQIKLLKIC
ncbi:hypothetical protein ACA348_02540 [Orientia tsutsugamushi]